MLRYSETADFHSHM